MLPCSHIAISGGVAEWLSAVGTVGATVAAVWIAARTERRERARRPVLGLEYRRALGYSRDVPLLDGSPSHWLRLQVGNRKGRQSADGVEVSVISVFKVEPAPAEEIGLGGLSLRWSNTLDSSGTPITRVTIPPGMFRTVDLLALRRPQSPTERDDYGNALPGAAGDPAPAELQVWPVPAGERHLLDAGKYEVWLAVTARDTDAVFYVLGLTFDGKWWEGDEVEEHLEISRLRRHLPERVPPAAELAADSG